ncbi:hypothetical protein HNY73_004663 [Argiope bruennichi]|uniref:Uncharacterized protein n=1 Tax=Argiope bruennichi TaxID=94029 RepID=A0A8T0FRA2_ARGBR|nr:hypothetical protein HNY73_004663 [Argiope bruennichi]
MAASNHDSKIILPFIPSLSHIASAKVAIELHSMVDIEFLLALSRKVQSGNLTIFGKDMQEKYNEKYEKAKKVILHIPTNLRQRIFEIVQYIHDEVGMWKSDHSAILCLNQDYIYFTFYWRCDGTIDRTKTAQEIIGNEKINVKKRFVMACIYCLEYEVTYLWAKLELCVKLRIFEKPVNSFVFFWVRWLCYGGFYSWTQYVQNFLMPPLIFSSLGTPIRFSSFLSELRSENRRNFYKFLELCHPDDFRFCIYQATKEEQKEILKMHPVKVLLCYLDWPLQTEFLEVADKMWNYLQHYHFGLVLEFLMAVVYRTDFDYKELLVEFWSRSPDDFKVYARKAKILNKQIDLFFSGRKNKTMLDDENDRTSLKSLRGL